MKRIQQVFTICILLVFCSLLLVAFTKPVFAGGQNKTAVSGPSYSNEPQSPNVITQGIVDAADRLSYSLAMVETGLGKGLSSAGKVSTKVVRQTGKTAFATSKATVAAGGKLASIAFSLPASIFHIAVDSLSFAIGSTPVRALTRPADNAQVPVIDLNNPVELPSPTHQLAVTKAAVPTLSTAAGVSWPIHGAVTTEFGVPHWPFQPTHTGIDISDGKAQGITPIHPFEPGIVVDVVHSGVGFGNHVVVDHGNGLVSLYGHMFKTAVSKGQRVDGSTVLGYEGSTGASTGSHVHFEIHVNGVPVNPHKYVGGSP